MRGSIRQRGSSYTAYWFVCRPADGKRVQHTRGGFATKGAARKHLNSILGQVQDGKWRPDAALTVRQLLLDYWLAAQKARELRPATLA